MRGFAAAIRHFFIVGFVQWWMALSYLWVWLRRKVGLPCSAEKLSRIHLAHARRFRRAASDLKGANIKTGQLASLQADILPPEYVREFKALRDEVKPTPYRQIARMIREQLGDDPKALFGTFDETPIAAASMAQVHKATLPDGREVAVKVLHPGLERSVDIDMFLLRRLVGFMSLLVKWIDLRQMYREIEGPLRMELDMEAEGRAAEELGAALSDLEVKVPEIHWDFTTRRVLTMEFLDGTNINNLGVIDGWGVDRRALVSTYLAAYFRQAFEGGFFHCDPHPANAFCLRDGRLALLDFGMVKRIPDRVRLGLVKEIIGGFFNNPEMYADGLIDRGVVGERERHKIEAFARETFSDERLRSTIFDHVQQNDGDIPMVIGKVGELVRTLETFRTPHDQLMFMRALGIVIDVCREAYPEATVSELSTPVVLPVVMRFLQEHPQYMEWGMKALPMAAAMGATPNPSGS